jgi:hypothetical protein
MSWQFFVFLLALVSSHYYQLATQKRLHNLVFQISFLLVFVGLVGDSSKVALARLLRIVRRRPLRGARGAAGVSIIRA